MSLLLFVLLVIALTTCGTLVLAAAISYKYGDSTASYPLFAIRDELISAAALEGVPRDDPWLHAAYQSVNAILVHSNAISGPGQGWRRAAMWGSLMGAKPHLVRSLPAFPTHGAPPVALQPIFEHLDKALRHLLRNHSGLTIQLSATRREEARIQRQKARELQQSLSRLSLA